jgi:O-antigen chain-terminating methyltransferase
MAIRRIEVQEILESVAFMTKRAVDNKQGVLIMGDDAAPWNSGVEKGLGLEENLRVVNDCYDVRTTRQIDTPRRFMRSLVLRIKHLVYDEIRAALDPMLDKQVNFNASVTRCVNELHSRMDSVRGELSSVVNEMDSVRRELSTAVNRLPTNEIEARVVQMQHTLEAIKARTPGISEKIGNDTIASVDRPETGLPKTSELSNDDFVKLAYEYILGRGVKEEELRMSVAHLHMGGDRASYLKSLIESAEFWHKVVLAENLRHITERVIEVPWCFARIRNAKRVLDVGCSESDYLDMLSHLDLYGVDVRPPFSRVPLGMGFVKGDVTKQPFRPDVFDVVVCISILEHIGAKAYGMKTLPGGDIQAMSELMRSTRPGGRLLVTVPYGRREDHGWLRVYDESSWRKLVGSGVVLEEQFFRYRDGRYEPCRPSDLQDVGYILPASPLGRAGGIVCAEILRQ